MSNIHAYHHQTQQEIEQILSEETVSYQRVRITTPKWKVVTMIVQKTDGSILQIQKIFTSEGK